VTLPQIQYPPKKSRQILPSGFFNALAHRVNPKTFVSKKAVSKILDTTKMDTPTLDTHHPLPKPSPGFYHANHLIKKIIVQTTPQATACYPPKKPGICHGLFFCS
jgi:hypothetical protein